MRSDIRSGLSSAAVGNVVPTLIRASVPSAHWVRLLNSSGDLVTASVSGFFIGIFRCVGGALHPGAGGPAHALGVSVGGSICRRPLVFADRDLLAKDGSLSCLISSP